MATAGMKTAYRLAQQELFAGDRRFEDGLERLLRRSPATANAARVAGTRIGIPSMKSSSCLPLKVAAAAPCTAKTEMSGWTVKMSG